MFLLMMIKMGVLKMTNPIFENGYLYNLLSSIGIELPTTVNSSTDVIFILWFSGLAFLLGVYIVVLLFRCLGSFFRGSRL